MVKFTPKYANYQPTMVLGKKALVVEKINRK